MPGASTFVDWTRGSRFVVELDAEGVPGTVLESVEGLAWAEPGVMQLVEAGGETHRAMHTTA